MARRQAKAARGEPEPGHIHQRSRVAPLTSSFAVTAIVGFFISVFFVWPMSASWGFTFTVFFLAMAIAAFISMLRAPPEPQLRP